jgi:hypothetical protein
LQTQTAVGKPGIEEHFYLIWSNIVIILRFTLILQQKMSEGTLGSSLGGKKKCFDKKFKKSSISVTWVSNVS